MYDWPEVRPATDAFWAAIRDHLAECGVQAPAALSRDRTATEVWQDRDLLLAQTCGLPFVSGRCGTARVIARPDYGIEGARDGLYCSALICRRGAGARLTGFRGARAAINEYGSQSGCNALADAVGETDFFGAVTVTGTHRASASMVADGDADLAAIDAVAWALFQAHEPVAAGRLTVLDWTRPMPALPFITGAAHVTLSSPLRDALGAAGPGCLGLPARVLPACDADYAPIRAMAAALAGRRLAHGTARL